MGREVRMVPQDWEHPRNDSGRYIPLLGGSFGEDAAEWDEGKRMWDAGKRFNSFESAWIDIEDKYKGSAYDEWAGKRPQEIDYMPNWPAEERTHYMMYETTSEGTPLSPAFSAPEELARWLTDTGASAFASDTATYEQWLRVCRGGYAPSAVYSQETGLVSGVAAVL